MRTFVLIAVFAAIACWAGFAAGAPRGGFAERIVAAATRGLPPSLAVVEARPPASLRESASPHVEWKIAPHAGEVSLWVTSGKSSAWVPVRIAPVRRVIVAARALQIGDVIGADDLRLAAAAVDGTALEANPSTLLGASVMTELAEGAVIGTKDLQRAAPIPRGSVVRIEVRAGSMLVTAQGTLERDARPGDTVSARLASMHTVRGRLVDSHTLEVVQ